MRAMPRRHGTWPGSNSTRRSTSLSAVYPVERRGQAFTADQIRSWRGVLLPKGWRAGRGDVGRLPHGADCEAARGLRRDQLADVEDFLAADGWI